MSYRGRPSKGCESCRNRKVKCDEKKPICTRCSRAGHDCAYRDYADLLFRNQTAVAAQHAEDSWRKRSKNHQAALSERAITKSPPSDKSSPPISSSQGSRQFSPREAGQGEKPPKLDKNASISFHGDLIIAPEVHPNLHYQANERFLYDFIFPESPNRAPEESTAALWSFIPTLYQNAAEGSALVTVVDALAYINFAHRCNAPQAEALAEACQGKTITSLSKAINDKKLVASNETVCCSYLLGVYEMILWQQLIASMKIGKRPPPLTQEAISIKESLLGINSTFNVAVMQLIWSEATLHSEWYEMKRSEKPPANRLDLQDLLKRTLALEREFQAWPSTIPQEWTYYSQPNIPETQSHYQFKWQKLLLGSRGSPSEIHSHHNVKGCWLWSFYRTTHLFLLRDLLEMLNWMFRLPELDYITASPTPLPPGLDNGTIHQHHISATNQLVHVVEKACSAIISSFNVPIHTKSLDDVAGMRVYIPVLTIGVMDAIVASGLVPDAHPSSSTHSTPPPKSRGPEPLTQTHIHSTTVQHTQLAYRSRPPHQHWTDVVPQTPSPKPSSSSLSSTPAFDATAKEGHIFDSGVRHPYDHPVDFAALGLEAVETRTIDVAARREWLNCALYYMGSRLGFKKALYVPMTENYTATVVPIVDAIFND